MVYAIAAYTITLGVLGLYWVMIQHRRREFASELARLEKRAVPDARSGFNLGACLTAPLWMLGHGMPIPGLLVLVPTLAVIPLYVREMWVPLLFVASIPIAAGAALGYVGNRIGVAHTGAEEPEAFFAKQLPWALAGVFLHSVAVPWAWYFMTRTAAA